MSSKVLNVSEARRLLPSLVRSVGLRGAVAIGARGQASAVLVGIRDYEDLRAQASRARGGEGAWSRLKLVPIGTIEEVEAELLALRRERAAGRPAALQGPRKKRRSPSR